MKFKLMKQTFFEQKGITFRERGRYIHVSMFNCCMAQFLMTYQTSLNFQTILLIPAHAVASGQAISLII